MKYVRGLTALILGFVLTTFFGLLGCVLAFVLGLPAYYLGWNNPARRIMAVWSFLVDEICVKRILGARVLIGGEALTGGGVIPVKDDEVVVCVANHPSTLLIPTFTRFVTEYICKDIVAIGKREHLRNPVTGWFMKLAGTGILVDRDSNDATGAVIKDNLKKLLRTPLAIVIFPDMRRPSPERIAADRQKFVAKVPDINEWLHHTMMPRSGALYSLIQGLKGCKVRFLSITTASSDEDDSVLKIANLVGGNILVEPLRFDRCVMVGDRQDLNNLLNDRWKKINQEITRYKRIMKMSLDDFRGVKKRRKMRGQDNWQLIKPGCCKVCSKLVYEAESYRSEGVFCSKACSDREKFWLVVTLCIMFISVVAVILLAKYR